MLSFCILFPFFVFFLRAMICNYKAAMYSEIVHHFGLRSSHFDVIVMLFILSTWLRLSLLQVDLP
jgi:hypothetical protein